MLLLSTAIIAQKEAGGIDSTFNTLGTNGFNSDINDITIGENGDLYVLGSFSYIQGVKQSSIAKLNKNGVFDKEYGVASVYRRDMYCSLLQSDGKLIIGGDFSSYNSIPYRNILRLDAVGDLDTTFNIGTGASGAVHAMAEQEDGKVLIGGEFSSFNSDLSKYLTRLNSNGERDTTFNVELGFNGYVYDIAIQEDEKILVAGMFSSFQDSTTYKLLRLNKNGLLDTTFKAKILDPKIGYNAEVRTIAIAPDGKIVIGGFFIMEDDTLEITSGIARLLSDGALDTTFNPGVGIPSDWNQKIYDIEIEKEGTILVGGKFNEFSASTISGFVRLNEDGSLNEDLKMDIGFFGNSSQSPGRVRKILIEDDKIYLAGDFRKYEGQYVNHLVRIRSKDVDCVNTFKTDSVTRCGAIVWKDGRIYDSKHDKPTFILPNSSGCDSVLTLNLTLTPDTVVEHLTSCDTYFWERSNKTYYSSNPSIVRYESSHIGCDTVFVLDLNITKNTGIDSIVACDRLTWIDGDTYDENSDYEKHKIVDSFGCDSTVTLNLTIKKSSAYYFYRTSYDLYNWEENNQTYFETQNPKHFLTNSVGCDSVLNLNVMINPPPGTIDAGYGKLTTYESRIYSVAKQKDEKVLFAGGFSSIDRVPSKGVCRLNYDYGGVDTTFKIGSGPYEYSSYSLKCMVVQEDGKILIGGIFSEWDGHKRDDLVRLNVDGSLDESFTVYNAARGYHVYDLAIQPDGKILIASGGSYEVPHLERINVDGTEDLTFNKPSVASISKITLLQNGKILIYGEDVLRVNSVTVGQVARLNSDGSLDETFQSGTGFFGDRYSWPCTITELANGKLIAAGRFSHYNDVEVPDIIRLNANGTLDPTFNAGSGIAYEQQYYYIQMVKEQKDGKLLVGGNFDTFDGEPIRCFLRLMPNGEIDRSFAVNQRNFFGGSVYDGLFDVEGKFIIVGGFSGQFYRINIGLDSECEEDCFVSFENENLLNVLLSDSLNVDLDGDGRISNEEAKAVTRLVLSGFNLYEISEIEVFNNLNELNLSNNNISDLDLSDFSNLDSVNIEGNPNLTYVCVNDSQLIHNTENWISSDVTEWTTVGCGVITSNSELEQIQAGAFPNHSNGFFKVTQEVVGIYSMEGKLLMKAVKGQREFQVSFASGTYLLQYSEGKSEKLIIQK